MSEPPAKKKVVILVHGIRDHGSWMAGLADYFRERGFDAVEFSEGRIRASFLLLPRWARASFEKRVRRKLSSTISENANNEVLVFAHSYGTYLLATTLAENTKLRISRAVLYGAIISRDYVWKNVAPCFGVNTHPARVPVVNCCGNRDTWPIVASIHVTDYGSVGCRGFKNLYIHDRYFEADHSSLLQEVDAKNSWIPYLAGDSELPESTAKPIDHDEVELNFKLTSFIWRWGGCFAWGLIYTFRIPLILLFVYFILGCFGIYARLKTFVNSVIAQPTPAAVAGSIGDLVWHDANGNGKQDGNETGIPGAKVHLFDGTASRTVVTNADGKYLFPNLPAGKYRVSVEPPPGFSPTDTKGSDTTPENDSSNSPVEVKLLKYSVDSSVDFGFYKCDIPNKRTLAEFVKVVKSIDPQSDSWDVFSRSFKGGRCWHVEWQARILGGSGDNEDEQYVFVEPAEAQEDRTPYADMTIYCEIKEGSNWRGFQKGEVVTIEGDTRAVLPGKIHLRSCTVTAGKK